MRFLILILCFFYTCSLCAGVEYDIFLLNDENQAENVSSKPFAMNEAGEVIGYTQHWFTSDFGGHSYENKPFLFQPETGFKELLELGSNVELKDINNCHLIAYNLKLYDYKTGEIRDLKEEIEPKLDSSKKEFFESWDYQISLNETGKLIIGEGYKGTVLYDFVNKEIIAYLPVWPHKINSKDQAFGLEWVYTPNLGIVYGYQMIDNAKKAVEVNRQPEPELINENGLIVGVFYDRQDKRKLFFWDEGHVDILDTSKKGYVELCEGAMNSLGQVAGVMEDKHFHAYLFERSGIRNLGTLYGEDSFPLDINDSTWVVGKSSAKKRMDAYDTGYRAFVWDKKNGMRDLNHLIPKDSGWDILFKATAINNKGFICGEGRYQGKPQAFLLIPRKKS